MILTENSVHLKNAKIKSGGGVLKKRKSNYASKYTSKKAIIKKQLYLNIAISLLFTRIKNKFKTSLKFKALKK